MIEGIEAKVLNEEPTMTIKDSKSCQGSRGSKACQGVQRWQRYHSPAVLVIHKNRAVSSRCVQCLVTLQHVWGL